MDFTPEFIDPQSIRSDRMLGDPIKVMQASKGGINGEWNYPDNNSPLSDILRSAFFNTWTNAPEFFNDGTADSVVTDAGTTSNTYVVASGGASVVAGHLVRATGFTNAANNKTTPFRVASSTATTIVGTSLSLSAETAPPGTARLKVVGFMGASGDITATASGLGSTSLNFTTLGLVVGQWIKIDSTTAGNGFATTLLNTWIRITAIAATALTCDNLPAGWTTDNGSGKTIACYFGDTIKNGTTTTPLSIEKGFMDLTTPVYMLNAGMVVNTFGINISSRQIVQWNADFLGMGGSQSTTSIDSSPDAAITGQFMAGNADVGQINEAGSRLTSPSWARDLSIQISNNLRALEAVDSTSPVGINPGECTVNGTINFYFGDNTLLAKLYAGTASSINARIAKNSQATIWTIPRELLRSGTPAVSGKNTDVMLNAGYQASIDTTYTNAQVTLDRIEYYQ